jgi:hypothetical protein
MVTDPHKSAEPRTWVIVLTGLVVVISACGVVALWGNSVGIVGWVASRPPLRVAAILGGLSVLLPLMLALSSWRWRRRRDQGTGGMSTPPTRHDP